MVVCLNIDDICRKDLHFPKSTLEKIETSAEIVGSNEKICGLAIIPGEQLGANLVQ